MKYSQKNILCWILHLGFLANCGLVYANDVHSVITRDDFAYGIEIKTKNKQAIQAAVLPAHFYENLRNSSLGDYRIFDSRGQIMPSLIKNPNIDTSKTETKILDFYPINAPKDKNLDALSLSLDRKENQLSVVIDDAKDSNKKNQLVAYILENNEQFTLDSLQFEWLKPETGFIKNIRLEHSSDLINWSILRRSTSLSRLQHQNRIIGNNVITVGKETKQYIRLSWSNNKTEFIISKISANYKQKGQSNAIDTLSLNPTLQQVQESVQLPIGARPQKSYIVNLPGNFPISEIEINSSFDNYRFQARLHSRRGIKSSQNKKQNPWNDHNNFEQYHLLTDDQILKSKPKKLPYIKRDEWLLVFNEPKNMSIPPEIKMTWQPEYIVFIAQGQSPYTLAYGNPSIPTNRDNTSNIISKFSKAEWQSITSRLNPLSEPKELGGTQKLLGPPATTPWRIILLWITLILGVLALTWMVFKLLRHSKQDN